MIVLPQHLFDCFLSPIDRNTCYQQSDYGLLKSGKREIIDTVYDKEKYADEFHPWKTDWSKLRCG